MDRDTRLIQTAVWGDPGSDEPLICPTEPEDLDVFREEYRGETIWCGALLGGCGGQLGTKRYDSRVCHFSHLPDPEGLLPVCGRRAGGVSSADHLYVKTATHAWLHKQGHAPRYRFIDRDDVPVGSVVEIQLDGHMLRIHMNRSVPPDWEDEDARELILGPGVSMDRLRLIRRRYVNRVKFESDGNSRTMRFGTETPHEGTTWFDPSECEITPAGQLKTPVVARIWNTEGHEPLLVEPVHAGPATATARVIEPRVPVQIGALVRQIKTAVREEKIIVARQLCHEADTEMGRCEGLALQSLEQAVTEAREWLDAQDRLRQLLFTRLDEAGQAHNIKAARELRRQIHTLLRRGDPPSGPEARVLAAVTSPEMRPTSPALLSRRPGRSGEPRRGRRTAASEVRNILGHLRGKGLFVAEEQRLLTDLFTAAESAGDWLSARQRRDVAAWEAKSTGPRPPSTPDMTVAAPARVQEHSRTKAGRPQLAPDVLASAAAAVRGALKKAAREGTTTTWARLERQLGHALPRMGAADRVQVLVLVDQTTPADQALLSSLVAAGDPEMAAHYPAVAAALGLEAPSDEADLRDVLNADIQQVYDDWRQR